MYRRGLAVQRPVHALALRFPDDAKYDLANQMRRACKSSPTNIAEGYARRRSPKDFCSHLALSVGSANKMEVHFKIANELDYISSEAEYAHFIEECQIIGKQLTRPSQYWRTKDDE